MCQQILRTLSDVRKDILLGKLEQPQVPPRVVDRRRQVCPRIDQRSVQIKEYRIHADIIA